MFTILNLALSWAITSFGNKFCLKKRSRLIKAFNNRFYVKFMQLEISLMTFPEFHFETEAKAVFPSACIQQRRKKFECMSPILNSALSWAMTSLGINSV